MDSWERFDETLLPDKKYFYSELYLEDITDKDYTHAQEVFREFKLKNLGDYHDLYVQSDKLLLADIFENFKSKCIEIYELAPAHFLSAPVLTWQACFKNTGVRLGLLNNIYMSLMVEKVIQSGICHAIHRYAKRNDKYMKNYDKNIESSYVMYLVANNLSGWAMSQKLLVNDFEQVKKLSQFNKCLIKNYDENSDKGYILEVDVEYPKNLFNLHKYLPFLAEIKKIKKCKKLVSNIHNKENYVVHIRALKQALNH